MNICVYGAASTKIDQLYIDKVEELGRLIGSRGHNLVYGAGSTGCMGAAARGVKEAGGKVIGVIPKFFRDEELEGIFEDCDELIFTETMHERKLTMENRADAFITVPGGIGTFEEFFETLTLKQLGRHAKPIALYNINGYYDSIGMLMYLSMKERFVKSYCNMLYLTFTDTDEMFDYLEKEDSTFGLTVKDTKAP